MDRDGKLTFKIYGTTPVDTISDHNRLTGGSFCDYETTYTGVLITDRPQKKAAYYHEETDTGLTYAGYLATINNLSTPVTKTADQTMKITYTVTES